MSKVSRSNQLAAGKSRTTDGTGVSSSVSSFTRTRVLLRVRKQMIDDIEALRALGQSTP